MTFDICANEAHKLLSVQDSLDGVPVKKFTFKKNICFCTIEEYFEIIKEPGEYALDDGCIIKKGNAYIVLYPCLSNIARLNWTLAHELGHIYLGHSQSGPAEEAEANQFAAQLLMPDAVILKICEKYGKINARDIMAIFDVSASAARIKILSFKRHKWYYSLETAGDIWAKYAEKVEFYIICKERGLDYRDLQRQKQLYRRDYGEMCVEISKNFIPKRQATMVFDNY